MRRALAAAAALLITGCATAATVTPQATHGSGDDMAHAVTASCGLERWAVKTGTDPQAAQVDLTQVTDTTVAALGAIAAPPVLPGTRIAPVELTVYRVRATLTGFKMEADSDYHLILTDGTATMIAEIPDPACVGQSSPFLPGIAAARAAFDAQYAPTATFQNVSVPVTVTGVGFFDRPHGQSGMAPNAIEIHPVLDIQFGGGP